MSKADNNGGSTDYYKIKRHWKDCSDIVESRDMNYNQGNIMKVAFTFNVPRHDGTDAVRDLNKIIYFANRQLKVELRKLAELKTKAILYELLVDVEPFVSDYFKDGKCCVCSLTESRCACSHNENPNQAKMDFTEEHN